MRAVEDAALRVAKVAEQERGPDGDVGDVGQRDQKKALGLEPGTHLFQKRLGGGQMLEHVRGDHDVERLRPVARGKRVRRPPLVVSLPRLGRDARVRFHPGEKGTSVPHLAAQGSPRSAEIEEAQAQIWRRSKSWEDPGISFQLYFSTGCTAGKLSERSGKAAGTRDKRSVNAENATGTPGSEV